MVGKCSNMVPYGAETHSNNAEKAIIYRQGRAIKLPCQLLITISNIGLPTEAVDKKNNLLEDHNRKKNGIS